MFMPFLPNFEPPQGQLRQRVEIKPPASIVAHRQKARSIFRNETLRGGVGSRRAEQPTPKT
jgi:hypothetical protein